MTLHNTAFKYLLGTVLLFSTSLLLSGVGAQQPPVIIQPGAPGEPSRQISAEEASDLASILTTEADVKFMQGMISHHAQALTMTNLVEATIIYNANAACVQWYASVANKGVKHINLRKVNSAKNKSAALSSSSTSPASSIAATSSPRK